jgi:hypothetical protein
MFLGHGSGLWLHRFNDFLRLKEFSSGLMSSLDIGMVVISCVRFNFLGGTMILFKFFSEHVECWIKGRYFSDDRTCFCLDGAVLHRFRGNEATVVQDKLRAVIFQNEEWRRRVERLNRAEPYPLPSSPGGVHIPFFNDHPDTTVQDIIEVCRLAGV